MKRAKLSCEWEILSDVMLAGFSEADVKMVKRLQRPTGKVDVVLDTDTFNEIDDQYALAYLIRSDDRLNLQAIYAAPFLNEKSVSPEDGMEKSYREILKILTMMGREDLKKLTCRGSKSFLSSETEPVNSEAARDLAQRAMRYTEENPLYVVAIGAITNVASALLMAPEIRDRVVIVWLGGNALHWPDTKEFNLWQDVAAARIVFGCGVPLVQLPCMGVVSELTVSGPELEYHLRGRNRLCDYLVDITTKEGAGANRAVWSRVIWDISAVAWLLGEKFMDDCILRSPMPEYSGQYSMDSGRHLMRYVYHVYRDRMFEDLFAKLKADGNIPLTKR